MKVKQKGLSENSTMEMLLPSSLARETLYYVIGWGRFFCSTEYFVERSRMTSNILVFVVSGRIKLRAYGANRFAGAGQVIMIGADAPHTVWCREDAELLWIRCKGVTMDSYMRFLLNRSASPVFDTEDPEKMHRLFEKVAECAGDEQCREYETSQYLTEIFTQLAAPNVDEEINSQVLMRYMREHYNEPLLLSDLTEFSGLSQSYLIRAFRRDTGSTPHEYLLNYRLRKAMEMLRESDEPIETISERCGFNSTSHFARAFKKTTDLTPSEFRKMKM